ncbi:ankyrin repeat domain-containing protein [Wolbachia endosymbiont of Ctenocephalides felis wCfeT]|uniref:ankyrin repeat domain-containing protein n=1 Tax=Wolbachia endosymbiont of Ctenocephalides felis wCfeT TaxID=2732593 RepID=UPI001446077A|nr:ankyrin repeat domain-containing protein [Wolbachia endosymbiont of Ctenocephalides felis wCfeT]
MASDLNAQLLKAAKEGIIGKVKKLIRKGAGVNARDNKYGWTALHWAAFNGHTEVVVFLLGKGADVHIQNYHKETPLHLAAQMGHKDVVESLINNGAKAKINARSKSGWISLHYAACNGKKDVVELLIKKGAKINAKIKGGWTPLHFAVLNGHKDVVRLLIEKGANIYAEVHGITASHVAAFAAKNDYKDVLHLLEQKRIELEQNKNASKVGYIVLAGFITMLSACVILSLTNYLPPSKTFGICFSMGIGIILMSCYVISTCVDASKSRTLYWKTKPLKVHIQWSISKKDSSHNLNLTCQTSAVLSTRQVHKELLLNKTHRPFDFYI